jgi:hypothetical protein
MNPIAELTKAIAEFEAIQKRYENVGAWDSEPDGVFQELIMEAFGGSVPIYDTVEDWCLYEMDGAQFAAKDMGRAAQTVVDIIHDNPEHYDAMHQYVSKYCWRL